MKLSTRSRISLAKGRTASSSKGSKDEARQLVLELNMIPVVPPKSNRREPWDNDRELYKKRDQVERLFRRLECFRRIFSRFEKLDIVFLDFIYFAFTVKDLR